MFCGFVTDKGVEFASFLALKQKERQNADDFWEVNISLGAGVAGVVVVILLGSIEVRDRRGGEKGGKV